MSVDRIQKRLVQAKTVLKDLFDFIVKLIQWLEKAGMPEEVPRAQLYFAEAENNCSAEIRRQPRECVICV